jgi:outer membrane lipoprotein carrier protein
VTVRKAGPPSAERRRRCSPATAAIEKDFSLREAGERDGLEWVEAVPKAPTAASRRSVSALPAMNCAPWILLDSLGQTSSLVFAVEIERNPQLAPSLFRFTPPANTDVIGE